MKLREEGTWVGWLIWAIITAAVCMAVLNYFQGCSYLTITPKPVVAHEIAFDQNTQNAGLIDCAANGCLVTRGWMDRYRALETEFKSNLAADANIKPEGDNYRVSYEVTNHFIDLQRSHRSSP